MKTYRNFKKLVTSVVLSSLALFFVGCADKMEGDISNVIVNTGSLPVLTAGFGETGTKTFVEDSKHLFWHESDYISAFVGSSLNSKYEFNGETGDNAGDFSHVQTNGESGVALDCIYAVYPFNENNAISETGSLSVVLPSTQTYAENSFGANSNTMVAVTQGNDDTFLAFKNVCGFLKLKLYSTEMSVLKSISVSGNKSEKIAGISSVSAYHGSVPSVEMADGAGSVITVDCCNGVALGSSAETATEVWVVVPPTAFTEGITIVAKDIDGRVFTKSTSNEITIKRNEIQPMAALEAQFEQVGPARNEIWYTATEKVELYSVSGFNESVVSNVYNEETGVGVITFDDALSVIGSKAFYGKTALTGVEVPQGILQIASEAFYGCTSLQNVTLPGGIQTINSNAFTGCTGELLLKGNITKPTSPFSNANFTKIVLSEGVDTVGKKLFYNCKAITDVVMSNNIVYIGEQAFYGCSKLANITWSEGLKYIGVWAFESCTSITSLNLPEGLESIDYGAFSWCASLAEVYMPHSVNEFPSLVKINGLFYMCKNIREFSGKFATEDGLAFVYDGHLLGFANGAGLKAYSVPEGVTGFDADALYNETLESIEFPSTLKEFEMDFSMCKVLRSIKLHSVEVPFVGSSASPTFSGSYPQIFVPAVSLANYKSARTWSNYAYMMCGHYDGVSDAKVSDKKITYKATEKIEPYYYLGFDANVVRNEFDPATGVGEIYFDADIKKVGDFSFYKNKTITEVNMPEGVTEVGQYAFYSCSSLANVSLPSTLKKIGADAFYSCSLESVVIPNGVTTIDAYSFHYCSKLKSVVIPESVTAIGGGAFTSTALTEVTIPSKVTTIGNNAFFATPLEKVYCNAATPPTIYEYTFDKNLENLKIYVPFSSVDAYKTHTNWTGLADRIQGKLSDIDTPVGYTVRLNSNLNGANQRYGWVKSSSVSNPNSTLYDGVYESNNYRKHDTEAIMYIDINGLTSFSFYVKSHSEGSIDCVMVSQLDATINGNTNSNNSSLVKAEIAGNTTSTDWSIDGYTKVTFENIDGKAHRITLVYSKDDEDHEGNDRAYVLIPKEYGGNEDATPVVGSYTLDLKHPSATYGWTKSSVANPNSSIYDGVYESTNQGKSSSNSTMRINIQGYETFRFYIRSYAESSYDYVIVSTLDASYSGSTLTSNIKATTSGKQNSGTAIANYTLVEFVGLDKGSHTILVQYKKDSSTNSGNDKGYILIPKNQ